MEEAFTIKDLTCVHKKNRYLNLFSFVYERLGKSHPYFLVTRNPEPVFATPPVNAIITVAKVKLPHEDFKRLVVTKEFRISIGGFEWGFCAGLRDGDEAPEFTARRELKEETGLTGGVVTKISPPLISSAGMSDECYQMVWIEASGEVSQEFLESSEEIHTELLDFEGVEDFYHRRGRFEGVQISGRAWPILDQIVERGFI